MKIKNILITAVIPLLMAVSVAGCQNPENVQETKTVVESKKVNTDEVKEMVVAVNVDSATEELPFSSVLLNRSQFWGGLVFQGLLISKENINNVEKDLCEEYTISPDGKTYVFILKDDVYWHDGEKLTVEDVVFSIETCLLAQEVNGYLKKGIEGINGAKMFEEGEAKSILGITVEGNSITIQISKQDNRFLGIMAQLPILPKHCLENIPMEELGSCDFWKMPIGSGPYKVVENKNNKEAVLVLSPQYSGKTPKIEQIRYIVLENPETDYFDMTVTSNPEIIKKYQGLYDYDIIKMDNLYYRYLYFNLDGRTGENENLLQSKRVRQALVMALDKNKIAEDIYKGSATVMDGGIPQNDGWYVEINNPDLNYNLEAAKKILIEEKFDFSKTIVLTRYNQDDISVKLLEAVADSWNQLGIKTEIIEIGSNDTNKLWVDTQWYDVGLKNLSAVDYSEWYNEYSSENQMWSVVLKNRPVFNVLIKALDGTKWAYERKMLYQEIQQMEKEQVFKIPLVIVPQYVIYNSKNLYIPETEFPNYYYYYDLNMSQWEIIKE
ncbi:MAG: ABC transporter substrate-binding protein [Lachnospiraceae bacterium]|nr:ABC transporter substrate-binding protein [Lachnospiraceae bacterium]